MEHWPKGAIMVIVYQAVFKHDLGANELLLTRTLPDGSQDTTHVDVEDINRLEKDCRDFRWNESQNLSVEIGKKLFALLNGDKQTLMRAIEEADNHGECLHVHITPEGPTSNLPFEILFQTDFLVPSKVHLVRRVSNWGWKRTPQSENRPLRVLFMACSPEGLFPVLDFEKEEEAIYEVTEDLPIEMDVEDTGSLGGLGDQVAQKQYDVVHLSGHADIGRDGMPFFWMEDEEGLPKKVTPTELCEKLDLNLPRLLFLSGCRTGETPRHVAAVSLAHGLVAQLCSTVLGWGLPVSDRGASTAAKRLYFELSRGQDMLSAILAARRELYKAHKRVWPLLRLFSDGTPMTEPLIRKGQKRQPKPRDLQYTYLRNSQVKVLTKGFVGRRRQIQRGLRCLRKDRDEVGLLLHGTGGLGKSCLAGKLCERLKDHTLVIIHGQLNVITFSGALKDAFLRARDEEGLKILAEKQEMPDRILRLSTSTFQKRNYLVLLDDFEQNMIGIEEGTPTVSTPAAEILEPLLRYLPYAGKMSHLVITSRYLFGHTVDGTDLIQRHLESVGLTSFRAADERKKITELEHIDSYPDAGVRHLLVKAGRGNPRLMEALNTLLEELKDLDIGPLLLAIRDEQEEFVQNLILRRILEKQPRAFQHFLRRTAVYRLPVLKKAIGLVSTDLHDWPPYIDRAVHLSLMEQDRTSKCSSFYWVTPLLRENIFEELTRKAKEECHRSAVSYFKAVLSDSSDYAPVMAFELIEHALTSGLNRDAIEEAGRLLSYLRKSLMYKQAKSYGSAILQRISQPVRDASFARVLFELGWIHCDLGDATNAIEYYEQALSIDKEVYGDRHPSVARILGNLGLAWNDLGDAQNAIEYYEHALSIDKEVYGDRHPSVAASLSNLGTAWRDLGDAQKAIEYYERALSIDKEVYGERHPRLATILGSLGVAWYDIGDAQNAIAYYEQALSIDKEVYGDRHPGVAINLSNLGEAWRELGDAQKAIAYYEQALSIDKEVYGDRHPSVARILGNLGLAWHDLGDSEKAIAHYDQALSIDKEVYGDRHPSVATDLSNLGGAWRKLGDAQKAIAYFEQALSIDKEVYGDKHPNVATRLDNLGAAWSDLGDAQKAIAYGEQALSIKKEIYGERHPSVATGLNNLGFAWYKLGDNQKVIAYFEQALSIDKEVYGERHPSVATILGNLGEAWGDLGDAKKAIEYYEQALSIGKEVYGERHPSVATTLGNLGGAWYDLGDAHKAIAYFEQALSIDKEVYGDRHPSVATDLGNLGSAWGGLGDAKNAIEYYEQALSIGKEVYGEKHPMVQQLREGIESLKRTE